MTTFSDTEGLRRDAEWLRSVGGAFNNRLADSITDASREIENLRRDLTQARAFLGLNPDGTPNVRRLCPRCSQALFCPEHDE